MGGLSLVFRVLVSILFGLSFVSPSWSLELKSPHALQGRTIAGEPFALSSLRGKVVLVVFWSTECAVCRDKMPELRANAKGWSASPFELVTVSVDRRLQDVRDYDQLVLKTTPMAQPAPTLWAGDSAYRDTFGKPVRLPTSYLLDKAGQVVEKYEGRIPAEAWDRIAELL
ncbi:TlpA family protein disulfide reductase [Rhodoferax sp.]|uniref:TlpA family protein disulfide reductase n=1 Tax=Rhodoferax sp. TaxID=50421 RepID=UPI00277AD996|nr:TlpA disulfide reductase family protein [Rhodoferax sp.]